MAKATVGSGGSNQNAPIPKGAPAQFHDTDVEITGAGTLAVERGISVAGATVRATVEHSWDRDGWEPFQQRQISADDNAYVTASIVTAGRGRLTGHPETADGSYRSVWLRDGTDWTDQRVRALIYGGSVYSGSVATPQGLICLRGQTLPDGSFTSVVISNNVFLTDPNQINMNVWASNADGSTLTLGDAGVSKDFNQVLNRSVSLVSSYRFQFGTWINSHSVTPQHLYGLAQGDLVNINSADATFSGTALALTGADPVNGTLSTTETTTLSAVALKADSGTVTPPMHKKFWPLEIEAEVVGTIARFRVWRYGDQDPGWGSTRNVLSMDLTAHTNVTVPTHGKAGIVSAHFQSGVTWEVGRFDCSPITS